MEKKGLMESEVLYSNINKKVRLIILEKDLKYTKAKLGTLISFDEYHIYIRLEGGQLKSYLRTSIERIDFFEVW